MATSDEFYELVALTEKVIMARQVYRDAVQSIDAETEAYANVIAEMLKFDQAHQGQFDAYEQERACREAADRLGFDYDTDERFARFRTAIADSQWDSLAAAATFN